MAVLGLCLCARALSSRGKRGPLFTAVRGPPTIAGLSLSRPLPPRSTGSRRAGPATAAHGPSCSAACGILPDQGPNPCPRHWQTDSQPLCHQGRPLSWFLITKLLSLNIIYPKRLLASGRPWGRGSSQVTQAPVAQGQPGIPRAAAHSRLPPLLLPHCGTRAWKLRGQCSNSLKVFTKNTREGGIVRS